ncbi:MAG TPA: transcription-repair coupling factor, partial [Burkholderiales bacterium]|nr:transcription-repair coupling factor [Burkholderiales bacterium]
MLPRKRYTGLAGSSDALALARLVTGGALTVVSASAQDAHRLAEEMAWFAPQLRICVLPDWETLPYDNFSPHPDLVSDRLATLYRIQSRDFDVLLVPAQTAMYRLCPGAHIAAHTFFLERGKRLDEPAMRSQLVLAGYNHVTQVVAPGEYCVRGGLIDLYPMGSALPYRIELDDDVIDTIRTFDIDSQRTLYAVSDVRLLPAREFPLDEAARVKFRSRWRERFEGDPSKSALYRDISSGVAPSGIEYYLPLFFDSVATIFDYLPQPATVVLHQDVAGAIDAFWREASSRYRLLRGDPDRPLLPPAEIFLSAEDFFVRTRDFARIDLATRPSADEAADEFLASEPLPPLAVDRRANDPLAALRAFLANANLRVLVAAESPGRRETMSNYFAEYRLHPVPCASFEAFLQSSERFQLAV